MPERVGGFGLVGDGAAGLSSPCDKLPTLLLDVLNIDFLVFALFEDEVSLMIRFEKSSGATIFSCLAMFSSVRG